MTGPQGAPLKMVIGSGSVRYRFRPEEPSRMGFPEWTPALLHSSLSASGCCFSLKKTTLDGCWSDLNKQSNEVRSRFQKRLLLSVWLGSKENSKLRGRERRARRKRLKGRRREEREND